MLVLDTDVLTIIQRRQAPYYERLIAHFAELDDDVATTIITFEEQSRGWLSVISKARHPIDETLGYGRLLEMLLDFQSRPVLPFDEAAARQYAILRSTYRRAGRMDLKIASIVMAQRATLITRNHLDFNMIDGLSVIDLTRP